MYLLPAPSSQFKQLPHYFRSARFCRLRRATRSRIAAFFPTSHPRLWCAHYKELQVIQQIGASMLIRQDVFEGIKL